MKIKNITLCLHLKSVNEKINGDINSSTEIKVIDSQGNIILKMSSKDDVIMPDFTKFIKNKIIISTKDGEINGIIEKVDRLFGQNVYILSEINTEDRWFINGCCDYGHWTVISYDSDDLMVETSYAPVEIPLEEYIELYELVIDLYYHKYDIYGGLSSLAKSLPYFKNFSHSSQEVLEKFLQDTIGRILWIKNNEPKFCNALISALENKNGKTEKEKENKII